MKKGAKTNPEEVVQNEQQNLAAEQPAVPVEAQKTAEQIASLTQDLQRTRADFENFRKQTEMQRQTAEKTARLQTVYKLLPLLDDMGRAIASYQELAPLAKTLEKTLAELELKPVEAAEGVEFDPDVHDAAGVEGEGEREVIGEVLRPGYYYQGEILRPAMVKVLRTE